MTFYDWLKKFKEEDGGRFGLPACPYDEIDDAFEDEFNEKAEKLKTEYLSSEYAEETAKDCDKTLNDIFDFNTDY